jgi:pyrroline-5-carboxylate reductase
MVKIGFVGSGRMNSAIVKGVIKSGAFKANEIGCVDNKDKSGQLLA